MPFCPGAGLLEPSLNQRSNDKMYAHRVSRLLSGISGDMFLAALIDAGVAPRMLEDTVAALNTGARLEISRVNRSGIRATKVDVIDV